MSLVAIIPARGGSKGLPGKNTLSLHGRPLIVWSIEQALACPEIDLVLVSTDSPEIAAIAQEAGATIQALRPAELAEDTTPTEPVLLHELALLAANNQRFETVMLLQPTSPVRLPGTLSAAVRLYHDEQADSLVSVVETHAFHWRRTAEGPRSDYDYLNRPRRQDIPLEQRLLRETGSIYMTRSELLQRTGSRLGGRIVLHVMEPREGYEIDDRLDFQICEMILATL